MFKFNVHHYRFLRVRHLYQQKAKNYQEGRSSPVNVVKITAVANIFSDGLFISAQRKVIIVTPDSKL